MVICIFPFVNFVTALGIALKLLNEATEIMLFGTVHVFAYYVVGPLRISLHVVAYCVVVPLRISYGSSCQNRATWPVSVGL
jgi:hypothetical protein